ncbi:hypothetical protein CDAR_67681 [Caerostris darwini]|uniref:Uncharacterized protein n=1 Tax=Caerostris darwini TaxID=1538125 RepID=A0AAV4TEJ0_9ARAC|nr:hypothetical protein CDAR_67681 [Caerostris darwini]
MLRVLHPSFPMTLGGVATPQLFIRATSRKENGIAVFHLTKSALTDSNNKADRTAGSLHRGHMQMCVGELCPLLERGFHFLSMLHWHEKNSA